MADKYCNASADNYDFLVRRNNMGNEIRPFQFNLSPFLEINVEIWAESRESAHAQVFWFLNQCA